MEKLRQEAKTSELIYDAPTIVSFSFISRHVTRIPSDLDFTETPGITSPMKSGDVVEVEDEGVRILKNGVV